MATRREFAFSPLVFTSAPAGVGQMTLAMHQTTSAKSDFRRTLEAYSKAGYRLVELVPPLSDPFVLKEGAQAARRLLTDLGLKAVASGGVRGLAEPGPHRPKALEELKRRLEATAELGVDRIVCPCVTSEKYSRDDYDRGVENLREAGELARPYRVVLMPEFSRGSAFLGTLRTVLWITRQAAHPNVRPMFDFYHFCAGLSKLDDLEAVRQGEIWHVHLQDVPDIFQEQLDATTRAVPGEGVAPIVTILKTLARLGYSGPLSVELFAAGFQTGDPYEVSKRIREKSEPLLRAAGVV